MTPSRPAWRAGSAAAALCVAGLAAGCASTGSSATGQTSAATPAASANSPAVASTSASPSASAPAAGCSPSDLKAAVAAGPGGAAAGSTYYPLNFTNTSSSPCSMFGYPGISFVTGQGGSQIGRPASRNPAVPPATVVLAPGATAHVTLQVVDALNYSKSACQPVTAHWLKIFPPGQFSALYVPFSALTCSAKLPTKLGSALTVDAVKSGTGKPGGGL
jgi:Protein of unknown function (DUF4232)